MKIQRCICLAGMVAIPLIYTGCQNNKTGKTEKEVDTIAPLNQRYEDDTTINTVNRLSGNEKDTVTIIKKDSSKR